MLNLALSDSKQPKGVIRGDKINTKLYNNQKGEVIKIDNLATEFPSYTLSKSSPAIETATKNHESHESHNSELNMVSKALNEAVGGVDAIDAKILPDMKLSNSHSIFQNCSGLARNYKIESQKQAGVTQDAHFSSKNTPILTQGASEAINKDNGVNASIRIPDKMYKNGTMPVSRTNTLNFNIKVLTTACNVESSEVEMKPADTSLPTNLTLDDSHEIRFTFNDQNRLVVEHKSLSRPCTSPKIQPKTYHSEARNPFLAHFDLNSEPKSDFERDFETEQLYSPNQLQIF